MNQSTGPRPSHLRIVHSDQAQSVHTNQAQLPELTLTGSGSELVHDTATWSPARLILEMQGKQGMPFQVELTVIHSKAHAYCQEQAVSALMQLRPYLFGLGYKLEHVQRLSGVGAEMFKNFDSTERRSAPRSEPPVLI
jgi:hypothetical protein